MKWLSEGERRSLNVDLVASILLVIIGIFFCYDLLFSSKNFYYRDILNFHYPLRKFLIDSYARGELPLWNPSIYLGQPMLANPNYMAFYPTNLLHLFLPFNYAFKLHFILHPILGGLGAYFLSRRLGIRCLAAFTGALAYEFSGTVLSFLNLYNLIPTVALMPWIGWAFVGALKDRWLKRSLILGALLALEAIAFEPILFQCVLLLLLGLALLHGMETDSRGEAMRSVVRVSLVGAGFGAGLAAIQIIPTLELFPLTSRSSLNYVEVGSWSLHPLDYLSTLLPNFYGNFYKIGTPDSWGGSIHHGREPYLVSVFLGACTLLLAGLSFAGNRKKLRTILALLAGLSAFFALGRFNPVHHWLFEHIPLFTLGRYPSKYFLLATLALCLMAALGVESLIEMGTAGKKRILALAVLGLILAGIFLGCWIFFGYRPDVLEGWLRYDASFGSSPKNYSVLIAQLRQSLFMSGVFLGAGSLLACFAIRRNAGSAVVWLLPVLIAAELIPSNLRLSPLISDADVSYIPEVNQFIVQKGPRDPIRVVSPAILKPSGSMPSFNLHSPNSSAAWLILFYKMSGQPFDGITHGVQYAIDRTVDGLNTRESEALWKAFTQMNDDAKYALFQKINAPVVLSMEKIADRRLNNIGAFNTSSDIQILVYWLQNAIQRAYFTNKAVYARSQNDAFNKYLGADFKIGNEVILEGAGENPLVQPIIGKTRVVEYRNSRVLCEVDAQKGGYLVLLDSYYPGWKAFVDGRETGVLRANFAFRAVSVPAGVHRVEFVYRPISFVVGCGVTVITLLIGLTFVALRSRKRGKRIFAAEAA